MPIVERLRQFNTDFHSRLEAAGMRLMTWAGDELMALVGGTPPVGLTAVMVEEITLQFLETMEPKTWRTLYSILNVLDIEGVVEEIESYLSSKCPWESACAVQGSSSDQCNHYLPKLLPHSCTPRL